MKDEKFDPLALTIKEAHRRGIAVHAWLNTHLLANMDTPPTDPRHIYNVRPDLIAVPYKLARELYSVDPRDRCSARRYWSTRRLRAITSKVSASRQRRRKRRSTSTPHGWTYSDPLVYADSFADKYGDFRRAQVTDVFEHIFFGVKKRNPKVVVSADVFANAKDAYENRFQDWRGWLQRGFLDVAALRAYCPNTQILRDQIRVGVEAGGRDRIWAGIGGYRQPVDPAIEKIPAARDVGARGIVLFSYNSAVQKSELNPEADYLQRVMKAVFQDALISRRQ